MFKSIRFSRVFSLLAVSAAAAVPLAFVAAPAQAGTATTTFQVTATVVAGCTVSAGNIGFGNYDSQATAALNANAVITLYRVGIK